MDDFFATNNFRQKQRKNSSLSKTYSNRDIHSINCICKTGDQNREIKHSFSIDPSNNIGQGNIEYNMNLLDSSILGIEKHAKRMKFRLNEGKGECIYEIGIDDDGNAIGLSEEDLKVSISSVYSISEKLYARVKAINFYQGKKGTVAEVYIKKSEIPITSIEIKIGIIGEERSGRSTLLDALTMNIRTKKQTLKQNMKLKSKGSRISHQVIFFFNLILGFDEKGKSNLSSLDDNSWENIIENSVKLISFFDLGAYDLSFKSTFKTLSPKFLDYFLLVISAENYISNAHFISIAYNMNVPLICVFTKIDLVSQVNRKKLIENFKGILRHLDIKKHPILVSNNEDIVLVTRNFEESIIPTLFVSSTTNQGLDLLEGLLNNLPLKSKDEDIKNFTLNEKSQFDVHEYFELNENIIVTGIVTNGKIISGKNYYIGPDSKGNFRIIKIKDIHSKKISVKNIFNGQYATLKINSTHLKISDIRKGMVILSINTTPRSVRVFGVEMWTTDGSQKQITNKYQPIVNIKNIRQGVIIRKWKEFFEENTDNLKFRKNENEFKEESVVIFSKKRIKLVFEFIYNAEYVEVGNHLIINDNLLKAYGIVTKIFK